MFGIGFGEILVIALILIIVVGPARLPALMKGLGRTIRSVRQASDELRSSLGINELTGRPWDQSPPPGSSRPVARPGSREGGQLGAGVEQPERPAGPDRAMNVETADGADPYASADQPEEEGASRAGKKGG